MDGRTDRGKTVYPPPLSGSGVIITQIVFIFRGMLGKGKDLNKNLS
jgi:hypothetical protein